MCKLLIMTAIQNSELAYEFMGRMGKPMSTSNRDGIGYTAVKGDGSMFSERWLHNPNFLDTENVMTPALAKKLAKYKKNLPEGALDVSYGTYGSYDFSDVRTLTMHTRFATCEKSFDNVHPFIDKDAEGNDYSLIHNGTIRNAFSTQWVKGLDVNRVSTCDSEAALQTYISNGVLNDSTKAKEWINLLTGSWAFGVLGLNSSGNRILDVVRGTSSLYYMEAGPLGKIFTTNDDDALGVLKDMGIEVTIKGGMIKMDSMFRFDALTGEPLGEIDIKTPYVYSNHSYYNRGGQSTTSSSSNAHGNASSGKTEAEKETDYNKGIIAALLSKEEDQIPDLLNHKGSWDYNKAAKYYNNTNEPIIDRLEIWDWIFGDEFMKLYESLTPLFKEYVKQCDQEKGFKEARRMISGLNDGSIAM